MTTPNPYGPPAPGTAGAPAHPSVPPAPGSVPPAPGWPQPAWPAAPQAQPQHAGAPAPVAMPGTPASLGRRAAAYLIDSAIVLAAWILLGLIGSVLAQALGSVAYAVVGLVGLLLLIGWFLVYSAMQGGHGSIGMRIMKLQLVRLETGAPLGFGAALLRNVIWGLAGAIIVGYFSVLFDGSGRRQGWHDKVVHAFMRDAVGAPASGAPASTTSSAQPSAPGAPSAPAAPGYAAPQGYGSPAPGGPVPPRPPMATPGAPSAGNLASLFTTTAPPVPSAPSAPPAAPAPPVARPAAPAAAVPTDGLIAFVPGVTQDPPAPPASAAPAPVDELEEDTILVRRRGEPDVEDTRLVARRPSAVLEWDDGTRHTVSGRALFGRNPAGEDGVEAVTVRDETLSLSKTHFEIEVTDEGAFVVDRHSTNGVTIVRGGERIDAAPGERVALEPEDALEIGDRIATFKAAG